MNNIEDILDKLKAINRVDPPPFLFTRIEGRIQDIRRAPARWKWAFAVATLFVLMLNLNVILRPLKKAENSSVDTVISAMHLSNSNTLYNE